MTAEENKKSFKEFLSREYNKLVNYVRVYFDEGFFNADAEDIVQDVALNIYSKIDINNPIENVAGYFYRSVRNRIIDLQRKPDLNVSIENFTDENDRNILLDRMPDEDIQIEEVEEKEKLRLRMYKAIDKLKPDEQALIMETEFEGKTFEELSAKWNVPIGTLLSRKHRALSKIIKIVDRK